MFLQDVPLSGILLCYGPLILTILGFVLFAALTDADSRRKYLRRNVGGNGKRLADLVRERTRPMTVQTPAGSQLTVQPPQIAAPAISGQLTAISSAPSSDAPPAGDAPSAEPDGDAPPAGDAPSADSDGGAPPAGDAPSNEAQ